MAQLDSNVYFMNKGLDPSNWAKSWAERDANQQRFDEIERQKKQAQDIKDAYTAGQVKDANGQVVFDRNKTLSALLEKGYGEQAYALQNDLEKQNQQKEQAGWDRQFKERELKERMLDRQMQRIEQRNLFGLRQAEIQEARDQRKFEKDQLLTTPYGIANTPDDAKNLKDAHLAKTSFDNKLQQMIELREKHKGGTLFNRDDVGRGKQLSKDLLLAYKNMAKLGVLSQSDEDIVNAIIPTDPLEYNSPMAAILRQDPTLTRLKAFQQDSDRDFKDTIGTRVRGGYSESALTRNNTPKTPAETIRMTKDGQLFDVPIDKKGEAIAAGASVVKAGK